MPSSRKAKQAILKAIPAHTKSVYELGSGWGGLAFSISHTFPSTHVHAFEIAPVPWLVSKFLYNMRENGRINFYRKDFFLYPLDHADVVVCYLYPKAMSQLKLKFEKELKFGAWVISNTFAIPGWEPQQIIQLEDVWRSKIFVYRWL